MGVVHWSITASNDLIKIGDYIARDSPVYAINLIERLVSSARTLQTFPNRGRVVPEFNTSSIRELVYQNYRIVSFVNNDDVTILSISHCKMDLISKSKKEDWFIR